MPTRLQALWFAVRASGLRCRRRICGPRVDRLRREDTSDDAEIVAASETLLYPSENGAEFALQAGKVQNLRLAARALDGLVIPAAKTFSFWAHVPRPVRRNGFANGREVREGCVIPSVGGGLCQLSNALYDVALNAGCEIVERHAHTRRVRGSQAAAGRDATVFWNYVDLRFRPTFTAQLQVRLNSRELVVQLRRLSGEKPNVASELPAAHAFAPDAETCETCGVTECFRNPAVQNLEQEGVTAWLVDSCQPEFESYVAADCESKDQIFLPFDSTEACGREIENPFPSVAIKRRADATGLCADAKPVCTDDISARLDARELPWTNDSEASDPEHTGCD